MNKAEIIFEQKKKKEEIDEKFRKTLRERILELQKQISQAPIETKRDHAVIESYEKMMALNVALLKMFGEKYVYFQ